MSDLKTPLGEMTDRREILGSQIALLMGKGAVAGAALFFGIVIFVLLVKLVGTWLPDASREMPDPNILQRGALEQPVQTRTA